jgi:hypothetical protein
LLIGLGLLPVILFGFATDAAAGGNDGHSANFFVVLAGANERPVPATASDLTGTAKVRISFDTKVVCWKLKYDTSETVIAAHIHHGAAGTAGPVTFGFFNPPASTVVVNTGCRQAASPSELATVAGIAADPSNYYVNVHTTIFPGGAGRGQLTERGNS